ncbi:unnamed protein product [Urochloa decumbens]|uniref:Protein kinase domain-containing protein n=1 Tax=Urochloa decumbens TaxID=240449 RepID=A0ABC8VXH7_9POAL
MAGFISIDCGIAANSSYSDQSSRGLLYVSDAGYVDAGGGLNAFVRPPYDDPDMAVRYFPGGAGERSCYTLLGPVAPGGKYLVRTAFCYGNYDGLNELPVFDLHIGVNHWATVNVTDAGDLRMYPFDPYDRLWQTYGDIAGWTNLTTSATVDVSSITSFDKPTMILESASTPVNATRMDFTWSSDPSINSDDTPYLFMLYFAELQRVSSYAMRRFDILVDNVTWNGSQHYIPKYLSAEVVKTVVKGPGQHDFSLVATPDSTLPPILNAFEIYSVKTMNGVMTNDADGLEYLHKSCQPPLIHRDVKTKNILLSADLVAKIADFGLMKAFIDEFRTHVTTQPAGTLGYLDPEYYNTSQLSEKSDVYSFGVVLLELITGQPSSVPVSNSESIHVAQWVRQKLSEGDITGIADPRMGFEYEVNSVWKVTELALQCKEQPSRKRPTMTDIVLELKECLELEVSHALSYDSSSVPSTANNLSATSADLQSDAQASQHLGQQTVLELEQVGEASPTHIGPAPR